MHILMLCYEYPPIGGGGAKVVAGLIPELLNQGHKVDLVTMRYKNLPSLERKGNLNIHRVKCLRLKPDICTPIEMITYLISAVPLLIRLCLKNKYHINHTHFIFPDGILAYIIKNIFNLNYLITAHGSDVPGYNPNRFKFIHKIMVPLWKKIIKNSLKIICPSKSIQQLVFNADRNADTIVLPNGIDLKKFSDKEEKKKKILVVSRMFERKGVQYFLDAVKDINNGFEINIVGDGPYLCNLKEQADKLKLNVNFYGFIDNKSDTLKNLYETSLIFVFTSEAENFPIVLLEAMSAGLAIITTEKTGCAEVVGDTSLLVPVKNSNAIHTSLLRLINDPELCRKMGDAARLRLDKEFGWEAIAKKHIALYKNYSSSLDVKLSKVYQN